MLHTVNKSPFDKNSLETCLGYCLAGSAVLLIEDGVYGATKNTRFSDSIISAMSSNKTIYVLGPDLQARGIAESKLIDGIKIVDYSGFVDLAAEQDKVQAWL